MKNFIKNHKQVFFALYILIYMPWFTYLEKTVTVTSRFHVIHVPFDDMIPFCKYFVVPYYMWFIYVIAAVAFITLTDGKTATRMWIFIITGMTIFLVVSTVYPNGAYLRPSGFTHQDIFTIMLERLYASDTPTNLFPSIHTFNAIGMHAAICMTKRLRNNRGIKTASFILMVLIIMSTMLIKQHSVFDVVTAIILAGITYPFTYGNVYDSIVCRIRGEKIPESDAEQANN